MRISQRVFEGFAFVFWLTHRPPPVTIHCRAAVPLSCLREKTDGQLLRPIVHRFHRNLASFPRAFLQ
jgi:hypothetical protein